MAEVYANDYAIEISGGVKIHVPADVKLMTPYILLEQEDWFEDEIKFVRTFLQPGMRVIDIGVNYGTYFLTAAKKVGENGKVWGFEPSNQCCEYVEKSIATNKFQNTQLIRAGLSDYVGKAFLATSKNTELNTVTDVIAENQQGEFVELLTLDYCMDDLELADIDFMKIDAEGKESNIIIGGTNFFAKNSPLVMFELKHGNTVNHKLIGEFTDIGYKTYRLIPGLNCLVPCDIYDKLDAFQLNLFACKQDRADELQKQGILVGESVSGNDFKDIDGLWKKYLGQFKYFNDLSSLFGVAFDQSDVEKFKPYYHALDLYSYAHSDKNSFNNKYRALMESYRILEALDATNPNLSIDISLVRVSVELGFRLSAVEKLGKLKELIQNGEALNFPVPFIAPTSMLDDIHLKNRFEKWIQIAILVSHQLLCAFSSYYLPTKNMNALLVANNIGIDIPEIRRRIFLTAGRFKFQNANTFLDKVDRIKDGHNSPVWELIFENIEES